MWLACFAAVLAGEGGYDLPKIGTEASAISELGGSDEHVMAVETDGALTLVTLERAGLDAAILALSRTDGGPLRVMGGFSASQGGLGVHLEIRASWFVLGRGFLVIAATRGWKGYDHVPAEFRTDWVVVAVDARGGMVEVGELSGE